LKAANWGHTDIKLRERGTKKVHMFAGERGAGGQTQGCAGLDGRQDLEAAGQEGGHREARVAPKPRFLAPLKQKI